MRFRLFPLAAVLTLGAILAGCAATPYGGYSEGYRGAGPYYGGAYGYPYGSYDPYYGHRDRGFHILPVYRYDRHDRDRFRKHRRWGDADRDRHHRDRHHRDRGERDRDWDRDRDRNRVRDDRQERNDRHHRRERERPASGEWDDRSARTADHDGRRGADADRIAPSRRTTADRRERDRSDGERIVTGAATQERRLQSER